MHRRHLWYLGLTLNCAQQVEAAPVLLKPLFDCTAEVQTLKDRRDAAITLSKMSMGAGDSKSALMFHGMAAAYEESSEQLTKDCGLPEELKPEEIKVEEVPEEKSDI
jgi:hypothetical protein